MPARHYSYAPPTTLAAGINAAAVSVGIASAAGLPLTPFGAVLDAGTASEERVLVTAVAGTTLTIQRGYDGSTGKAHLLGGSFQPQFLAIDAEEASAHVNATGGTHGISGGFVGTADAQTVTNKIHSSSRAQATATDTGWVVRAAATGSADQQQWQDAAGNVVGRVTQGGEAAFPVGIFAGTNPAKVPLLARGASGQTAKIFVVQNNALAELVSVDKDGRLILRPASLAGGYALDLMAPTAGVGMIRVRESTNTTDVFTVDDAGSMVGGTCYFRGFFTADVFRYPTDGSKFKVDSDGKITAANTGGRIGYYSSVTTVTSSGNTEVITSDPYSIALKAGRRYRADFSVGLQNDTVNNSARAILRRSAAGGALSIASTSINAVGTAYISATGGAGLEQRSDWEEFTVPADGTYLIGPGVLTRPGAGSGNSSIVNWKVEITDIGV